MPSTSWITRQDNSTTVIPVFWKHQVTTINRFHFALLTAKTSATCHYWHMLQAHP